VSDISSNYRKLSSSALSSDAARATASVGMLWVLDSSLNCSSSSNGHVVYGLIPLNRSTGINKSDTATTRSSGKNILGFGSSATNSSRQKHLVSMVSTQKILLPTKYGSPNSTWSAS